jgi:hypothetical protein
LFFFFSKHQRKFAVSLLWVLSIILGVLVIVLHCFCFLFFFLSIFIFIFIFIFFKDLFIYYM